MKRSKFFAVMLVMMLVFTMTMPAFAVDATTSASTWTETPATPSTPAPTAPMAPTAPAVTTSAPVVAGMEMYVVVKGDVFWKIAMDHKLTTAELVKLNPQVKNPAVIAIGDKITVKAGAAVAPVTPTTPVVVAPVVAEKLYAGLGMIDNFRVRSAGKHQLNVAATSAVFDSKGRIVAIDIDVTELAMEEFQWPAATATAAELAALAIKLDDEIMTKGELKEAYGMGKSASTGLEWYQQMANFEKFFIGKTPSDIRAWYIKNTDVNGRPIKIGTVLKPEDQAKVDKLTDAEKAVLADVITGATMSLHDGHGFFLESIEKAYKNRVLVETLK